MQLGRGGTGEGCTGREIGQNEGVIQKPCPRIYSVSIACTLRDGRKTDTRLLSSAGTG